MDISKYKPTQKILDKLEGYRQKGSKVNVKAITNPDKLFTYYYASKLMGWGNLENDIWDNASYEDRQVLKEIDNQVSADASLKDSRSKDEVSLQNFSKVVAAYLKEKGLSYTFVMRSPHYNELEMDRRNGRCWTIAYTLTINGTLKIDFADHTNEGGGTYGYSIDHYGWNVIGKKELEAQIIRKIEDSGLATSSTAFAEEFAEYENMWGAPAIIKPIAEDSDPNWNTKTPGYYGDSIFEMLDKLSNERVYDFLYEYGWSQFDENADGIRDIYRNITAYLEKKPGYSLFNDLNNYFYHNNLDSNDTSTQSKDVDYLEAADYYMDAIDCAYSDAKLSDDVGAILAAHNANDDDSDPELGYFKGMSEDDIKNAYNEIRDLVISKYGTNKRYIPAEIAEFFGLNES